MAHPAVALLARSSSLKWLLPIGAKRRLPLPLPQQAARGFASTATASARTRDRSRRRGVSSLRRSGPRQMLSVSNVPLPRPRVFTPRRGDEPPVPRGAEVPDARFLRRHPPRSWPSAYYPHAPVSATHGLWGFFPAPHVLLRTPADDAEHGRAWLVPELRRKAWPDLHALWWVCLRERNQLSTARYERSRARIGFGDAECRERDEIMKKTMRAIKHVLTERYYNWEDARILAMSDPEIDMTQESNPYSPLEDLTEEQADMVARATADVESKRR